MPKKLSNIFLIGPMGSGKTSVGKQLARLANLPYYDSDEEIEKQSGVSISWIFELEGEVGFRKREANIIRQLTHLDGIVLSTGGGSILNPKIRTQLAQLGVVIFLRVSPKIQWARVTKKKSQRPLLIQNDSQEKLWALTQERYPLYEEIADLSYDTDQVLLPELAKKILHDIKGLNKHAHTKR